VPSDQPSLILTDAVDQCSVQALAFQPKGELLAVAGINYLATASQGDGLIALWDPAAKRRRLVIESGATALAWSPDGKRLAAASLRRVVRVHDAESGDVLVECQGHTDTVNAVAYSPDGKWLATAGDDRTVRLWDAGSGEQAGAWELDNAIKAVCFSPDGRWLFTGNSNTSCYQIEVEQLLDPRT
jgi:WD40 repeat protein